MYIIIIIALNLKRITCFPEAFKSSNVLDIVDYSKSNVITSKIIIIIIYRFSNNKVNKILMLTISAG